MLRNGFFVNAAKQLFAIVNGSMYPLETDEKVKKPSGYYDTEGKPVKQGGSFK